MTIQGFGAIGELVGGIAVIITLIYLALQIRQNTQAIRLSSGHAVTEEFRGMWALLAQQGSLADVIHRSVHQEGSISGTDKLRSWAYNNNLIRAFENAYIHATQDALDPRHWEGTPTNPRRFHRRLVSTLWERLQPRHRR